jgi:hypothetical protein
MLDANYHFEGGELRWSDDEDDMDAKLDGR